MPESARAKPIVNSPLRVVALLAAVIATAIALHLFNPTDWPALGVDILHSLHGPGFAAIALGILWYLQSRCASVINYILAAGITLGIGLISEVAQIPGPRDAQVEDLVVDALGIIGAIGVTASFDKKVRSSLATPARILLPAVSATALAIACVPTLWLSYAMVEQQRAFPSLLTFEHAWETATIGQTATQRPDVTDAPPGWPTVGQKVSHSSEDGRWGILLSVHPVQDWRGYASLSFVAASAGESFAMDIGVKDLPKGDEYQGIRFYKSITVGPEPKRYAVTFEEIQAAAKDRPFDFSLVDAVVFSAAKPGGGQELLLDDVRLEL